MTLCEIASRLGDLADFALVRCKGIRLGLARDGVIVRDKDQSRFVCRRLGRGPFLVEAGSARLGVKGYLGTLQVRRCEDGQEGTARLESEGDRVGGVRRRRLSHVYLVLSIRLLRRLGGQRAHYSREYCATVGWPRNLRHGSSKRYHRVKLEASCLQTGVPLMIVVYRRHAAEGPLCALEACRSGTKLAQRPYCRPRQHP